MAFASAFRPGEPIIGDETPMDVAIEPTKGRGLMLGRRRTPFGAMANAPAFPRHLVIPSSEWQARIQEKEETKTRLSDIADRAGLPCKDQAQTNYCWINAPSYAFELLRVRQNQRMVILSPASAGARIKQYRNEGGWGEEAIRFIASDGLVPVTRWPANAIARQYATPENIALAKRAYRCTEWWECRPRDMDELVTCLLLNHPCPVGYNWWGHEVTAVDAVWVDGTIAIRIRNSWGMGWGSRGYGILQGQRMVPDDTVAPRVALAA